MIGKLDTSILKVEQSDSLEFDISKYKISADQEIEVKQPVLSIIQDDEEFILFTEGSSSMIQGKAKSKKTTFLKAIITAINSGRFKNLYSNYTRNEVCFVDTEQDEEDCIYSTRQIKALSKNTLNRIATADF